MSGKGWARVIGLLSAVPEEGRHLIIHLKAKFAIAGKTLYRGRRCGKEIIYIISGIGKANAAHAATLLLERFSPALVILFGIGGAYPAAGLAVGDIAVAKKEVYADEGVLVNGGFLGTDHIGIPLLRKGRKEFFNEFLLDRRLCAKAAKSAEHVANARAGTFVTVSTCTGTRARARELYRKFGALCENMEGASVAQICMTYGIPMAEIRGISNIVERRDKRRWDIGLATEKCQKAVTELLKAL